MDGYHGISLTEMDQTSLLRVSAAKTYHVVTAKVRPFRTTPWYDLNRRLGAKPT